MQQASRLTVSPPSSALLKFLKLQSEGACFFTANLRPGFCFNDHAPRHVSNHQRRVKITSQPLRGLSTTAPRPATVEASFFSLDFLRPQSSSVKPTASLPRPPLHPRYAATLPCSKPEPSPWRRTPPSVKQPWLRHMWGFGKGKDERPGRRNERAPPPGFLDDGADNSMLGLGRSIAAKASNELKLRCTEFDENGNVTLVNGEFKKSELIAKYGLLPRDLRKIDSSLLPHMIVRPSAILINLLHLRVLIKSDRVLVFDAYGSTDSYTQSVFMYDLEGKLRQREGSRQAGGLPYEFRALEAVLISVTSALEGEFEGVREPVVRVLRELEEDIDRDKLRHLLIYSKKLGTFEQKATLVRNAIDELLEADDDLAAMYLTEKAKSGARGEEDHTEIEMLLENYHKLCDEIVQASGNLVSNIRNTEEIVKAILDANRNSLMLLDLKFSIGTLGTGAGAFVAALYGMNLKNFIEESDLGFLGMLGCSFALAALVCGYGLSKLRRVQRVSMWGEQGRSRRGSWRDVEPLPALGGPAAGRREMLARREREARADPSVSQRRVWGEGAEALPSVERRMRLKRG